MNKLTMFLLAAVAAAMVAIGALAAASSASAATATTTTTARGSALQGCHLHLVLIAGRVYIVCD